MVFFMVFIACSKADNIDTMIRKIDAGMVSAIQIPAIPFQEPEARILRLYRIRDASPDPCTDGVLV